MYDGCWIAGKALDPRPPTLDARDVLVRRVLARAHEERNRTIRALLRRLWRAALRAASAAASLRATLRRPKS